MYLRFGGGQTSPGQCTVVHGPEVQGKVDLTRLVHRERLGTHVHGVHRRTTSDVNYHDCFWYLWVHLNVLGQESESESVCVKIRWVGKRSYVLPKVVTLNERVIFDSGTVKRARRWSRSCPGSAGAWSEPQSTRRTWTWRRRWRDGWRSCGPGEEGGSTREISPTPGSWPGRRRAGDTRAAAAGRQRQNPRENLQVWCDVNLTASLFKWQLAKKKKIKLPKWKLTWQD